MYVRQLALVDFRSWHGIEVALDAGSSVFVGANGQGKTNLIEALCYLATLRSHRSPTDAPLVRAGTDRAQLRATVASDGRELGIELEIIPGKANRGRLNGGAPVRPREVLGALRTVLFAPEDLAIVRGDPSERRAFIDELLVLRSPRFAALIADYERILRQRAALLKSAGGFGRRRDAGADTAGRRQGELSTLDVWDGHLASVGAQLLAARLETLELLRPPAAEAYAQVAPRSEPLQLSYVSSLGAALPEFQAAGDAPAGLLEAALLAELARMRSAELERGVNLVGPHRDDISLSLGPLAVRGYASHGESWSAALSLRLGSFELLAADERSGGPPVLVLDDVFAELDGGRRDQLAAVAKRAEQTLITAAVASDVPESLQGARFDVHDATVRRVR
jgi:DNA replication and repair protein RecF